MKIKKELWLITPFIITTFGVCILNFLAIDQESSKVENRLLQQVPGIKNIIDRDYSNIYETYYSDQFIGRDEILKLYANYELKSNKSTVRNHYIVDNEWIFPKKVTKKDDERIQEIADTLNYFSISPKDSGKDIYYVSTPCKSQALEHKYPKYAEDGFVFDNLSRFEEKIDKNYVNFINIDKHFKDNISNKKKESMYFKTDHHWNAIGALEGFKYIIKNMNVLSNENKYLINDDNFICEIDKNKNFIGSYNLNIFNMLDQKDDVPYIRSKQNNEYELFKYESGNYVKSDINTLVATGRNNNTLTYSQAYIPDNLLYKVVNNNAPVDKKVLIIKDSFESPMTLWFADIFKEVEVFDPRIDTSIYASNVIKEQNPDIILFMFNSSTFDTMIDKLL